MTANEHGAAFALVIAVMLFVFTAVSALIYILENDTLSAAAYAHNIGGYEAAGSGVRYAVSCIRADLESYTDIAADAFALVLEPDFNDTAVFIDDGENPAGYYFINPGGVCPFHDYFGEAVWENIPEDSAYTLVLRYPAGGYDVQYNVNITVKKTAGGILEINAAAQNARTGVYDRIYAEAAFAECEGGHYIESAAGDKIDKLYIEQYAPQLIITNMRRR